MVKWNKQEVQADGEIQASDTYAIAETEYGTVAGYQENRVYIYKGIPYAKAERFMPPQNPEVWEGVRECTKFGPVARQIVPWYPDSIQNENELFSVNVWTQGISDGKKRPVMLWLHGGGFHVGASNDPMTYGKALAKFRKTPTLCLMLQH